MALDDGAVIIPGSGWVYTAPAGTASPVLDHAALLALDLDGPGNIALNWTNLGHTSRDDSVEITPSGGESTVKGSWQNPNLRSTTTPTSYDIAIPALQADLTVFGLYFGGGVVANDRFELPDSAVPADRATFIVLVDGATRVAIWTPKLSMRANGGITMETEDFLTFPLIGTVLKMAGLPPQGWYTEDFVTP